MLRSGDATKELQSATELQSDVLSVCADSVRHSRDGISDSRETSSARPVGSEDRIVGHSASESNPSGVAIEISRGSHDCDSPLTSFPSSSAASAVSGHKRTLSGILGRGAEDQQQQQQQESLPRALKRRHQGTQEYSTWNVNIQFPAALTLPPFSFSFVSHLPTVGDVRAKFVENLVRRDSARSGAGIACLEGLQKRLLRLLTRGARELLDADVSGWEAGVAQTLDLVWKARDPEEAPVAAQMLSLLSGSVSGPMLPGRNAPPNSRLYGTSSMLYVEPHVVVQYAAWISWSPSFSCISETLKLNISFTVTNVKIRQAVVPEHVKGQFVPNELRLVEIMPESIASEWWLPKPAEQQLECFTFECPQIDCITLLKKLIYVENGFDPKVIGQAMFVWQACNDLRLLVRPYSRSLDPDAVTTLFTARFYKQSSERLSFGTFVDQKVEEKKLFVVLDIDDTLLKRIDRAAVKSDQRPAFDQKIDEVKSQDRLIDIKSDGRTHKAVLAQELIKALKDLPRRVYFVIVTAGTDSWAQGVRHALNKRCGVNAVRKAFSVRHLTRPNDENFALQRHDVKSLQWFFPCDEATFRNYFVILDDTKKAWVPADRDFVETVRHSLETAPGHPEQVPHWTSNVVDYLQMLQGAHNTVFERGETLRSALRDESVKKYVHAPTSPVSD